MFPAQNLNFVTARFGYRNGYSDREKRIQIKILSGGTKYSCAKTNTSTH